MRSKEAKLRRNRLDQEDQETEGMCEGTEELHPRSILPSLLSDNQTQVIKIKSTLTIERLFPFPRDISNRDVSEPRTGLLQFVIFEFNCIINTSLSSLSPNMNPIRTFLQFQSQKGSSWRGLSSSPAYIFPIWLVFKYVLLFFSLECVCLFLHSSWTLEPVLTLDFHSIGLLSFPSRNQDSESTYAD